MVYSRCTERRNEGLETGGRLGKESADSLVVVAGGDQGSEDLGFQLGVREDGQIAGKRADLGNGVDPPDGTGEARGHLLDGMSGPEEDLNLIGFRMGGHSQR
jgi:hypothetical protein